MQSDTMTIHSISELNDMPTQLHSVDDMALPEDDASSILSETSTVEYNQEPFSTFQSKVHELSQEIFAGTTADSIAVERMEGGAFNRIIGIKVSTPWYTVKRLRDRLSACARGKFKKGSPSEQYVLRIPRDTTHDLHCQVSMLAYLQHRLLYPVPSVVCYNSSENNALGRAYAIQKRLPGKPLHQLWPTLTLEQRKCAARFIAGIVVDLHNVTNNCAGIISPGSSSYDYSAGIVTLEPISMPDVYSHTTASCSASFATPLTTRDLLLDLVIRQRAHAKAIGNPPFNEVWDGFNGMINQLHALGLLPDNDSFHLYHPDLQSRNLLFETPSPSTLRLTGILDWDGALFAPSFMSTRSPFFLWTDEDADEEEEGDALLEHSDEELRAYKRIFEDVAGTNFSADAYRPEHVLARRMWRFLVNGITSGSAAFLAEEVLEEWELLHPTSVVGGVE